MNLQQPLKFKLATEGWEFEQIHRLNYKTFVEELPQHEPNPAQRLVDPFHRENTYIICLHGKELAGMISVRGQRPFSLDQKLPHLDGFLPSGRRACEVRLLAVDKKFRHREIFWGLVELLVQHGKTQGYDLAVISGNSRHEKLYRYLGFTPFGPIVGKAPVFFQPMFLTLELFEERAAELLPSAKAGSASPASFLPGPVAVHEEVVKALSQPPISHRSSAYHAILRETKQRLCELTGAPGVEIFMGSGTLANDVIAAQLSLECQPGLILCNGEFGQRLMDHATRFDLRFTTHQVNWGETFDLEVIQLLLDQSPPADWLWAAHCETSTGVLNDLAGLKRLCAERGLKLCLDCISSIGITPVNLDGVYLASCVSGKGLAAFPGLAAVFYNHAVEPALNKLPRYLDLGYYAVCDGVPFTQSSNLLCALKTALKRSGNQRLNDLAEVTRWLRAELGGAGFSIVADDDHAAPGVITLALPHSLSSKAIGEHLQQAGYLLSFGSEYLLVRNWIQICLMGEYSRPTLQSLLGELRGLLSSHASCQAGE